MIAHGDGDGGAWVAWCGVSCGCGFELKGVFG